MKRTLLAMAFTLYATITVSAQVEVWKAIAQAPRDMQTEKFGKAMPQNIQIIRDGNRQVLIDTTRYEVTQVNRDVKTDSLSSVEFTATDWRGKEFIIKFNRDLYADSPLMHYCVIAFAANTPYDWTYYFCEEPK